MLPHIPRHPILMVSLYNESSHLLFFIVENKTSIHILIQRSWEYLQFILLLFLHFTGLQTNNKDKQIMCKQTSTSTEQHDELKKIKNSVTNQKWVLSKRPNGNFNPDTDAKLISESIFLLECEEDEVVVETQMLSVDAFIRTMLDEEAYHGSVVLGNTIPAIGYGKVIHAGPSSGYKVGNIVQGMVGSQTHAKIKASNGFLMRKINFPFVPDSASLGLMGLTTGITAYAGVFYCLQKPKKGETVVVTAAAGAVGSIACQLAKSTGARVIGVAGGSKKGAYLLDELNIDGSVDYKHSEKSVPAQLDELCPNGVDFVYDNVGGPILDDLLNKINRNGRIVVCGAVSQYSDGAVNRGLVRGPSNYLRLAERGATMSGFNVMQYGPRLIFAIFGMFWMYLRGKVIMKEHIELGIEYFPSALNKLFTGGHMGKLLVKVNKTNIK